MMAAVGIYSVKRSMSLNDFVVGGRKAGAWMSAFTYGSTYFSAVVFVGYAGRAGWDYGLYVVLIGIANAILGTYIPWKVLAEPTREVSRRLEIKTVPQFFEQRYQSRGMKLTAAVIIFIFLTPYSASVYSGLSYICEATLGIPYKYAMAAIAVAAALFVLVAGMLNPLCLRLSPVALAWVLTYSLAKRFTWWPHLWLGLSLAIAPVGDSKRRAIAGRRLPKVAA
jgi:Na+/proline symporter